MHLSLSLACDLHNFVMATALQKAWVNRKGMLFSNYVQLLADADHIDIIWRTKVLTSERKIPKPNIPVCFRQSAYRTPDCNQQLYFRLCKGFCLLGSTVTNKSLKPKDQTMNHFCQQVLIMNWVAETFLV